jgi:hypothetical protein
MFTLGGNTPDYRKFKAHLLVETHITSRLSGKAGFSMPNALFSK